MSNEYFMFGDTKTSTYAHSKSHYDDYVIAAILSRSSLQLITENVVIKGKLLSFPRDPSSFVEGNAWNPSRNKNLSSPLTLNKQGTIAHFLTHTSTS